PDNFHTFGLIISYYVWLVINRIGGWSQHPSIFLFSYLFIQYWFLVFRRFFYSDDIAVFFIGKRAVYLKQFQNLIQRFIGKHGVERHIVQFRVLVVDSHVKVPFQFL